MSNILRGDVFILFVWLLYFLKLLDIFAKKVYDIWENKQEEKIMALLHMHAEEGAHWAEEILLDGLLDTLKIAPFLFLTYLLMEFIEHRAGEKAERFMKRAGGFAPAVGGLLGAVPQCGFSAAASNLYAGRIISVGTLVAVFLSTSDEMIPILISGQVSLGTVALIVLYKTAVGITVGFAVDLALIREGYVKIPDDFALNGTDAFGGEYYVKDGESLVFTRRK